MEVANLLNEKELITDKKKIFLNKKGFGNSGFIQIAQNFSNIVDLTVMKNNINHEGIKMLSPSQWSNLQSINLSYNPIGTKGCKYLSKGQWDKLEMLYLVGNQVGNDNRYSIRKQGLQHLSKARWPSLSIIKISRNGIGSDSGKVLSKANWTKLKSLDVKMNTLTEFDFKHMASMDCPGVRQLYLNKNRLEDEQAENTKAWIEKKFPEAGEISL